MGGEEPHLVGEAAAGGVDEVHDRQEVAVGPLEDADLLLAAEEAPRPGLDGRIVRHHGHRPPGDLAHSGDHAVGREVAGQGVHQQPFLGEGVLVVEEEAQPVSHEELRLLGELLVVLRGAALLRSPHRLGDRLARARPRLLGHGMSVASATLAFALACPFDLASACTGRISSPLP